MTSSTNGTARVEAEPVHDTVEAAAIIAALSAITTASASARPFTDPRADRSDAIDQAAALEPRDPAC